MKITLDELRKIVSEELGSLSEGQLDHAGARTVVNSASKLLKALDDFEVDEAPTALRSAVTPHIAALRRSLEDMVQNPVSYVDRPGPKVITVKKPKDKSNGI
jgi:hypothetical protein